MNVLFVTLGKFNSINDAGIYTDLLRYFKEKNHNVHIVSQTERRNRMDTKISIQDNVSILKVKTGNITKSNIIEKGISTVLLEQQYERAINRYFKEVKFDLILYSTPPITIDGLIRRLKRKHKASTYLLLKDIFPQNAVDLKMFSKKSPFYRYFRRREIQLYETSDYIGTMSKANSQFILNHNRIPEQKVEVCPNTITPKEIKIDDETKNRMLVKYSIPKDKKTFIYGGNLGRPQGIDFLISCIIENEKNTHSFFVIVGSGTEYPKLRKTFDDYKFKNSVLLSQLPKEEYEVLANCCDVGLIFLDYRFTIPNFPSRLLSYMQASMPVIAATDSNTDIGDVIEKGKFGSKILSNNVKTFNETIKNYSFRDDLPQLGRNARSFLEQHYSTEVAYNTIMKHFQ